ncbi:hypothetical protein [Noviherbaspirillum galbum]|uniref:Uncharacterized protein n=1 Tax=Noviherbaspirillum galbum TaxID=2709383 RepID=A0A6B3SH57_9BURK|nr:hypothetical protein [Noviherbaspirillum galbum]NEX60207.1 hypothetical protein [Noviherbaspirillum galbum]
MQIVVLHSISGDPERQHVLLAPKTMAFPEDAANLVIRRVAETNKDLAWEEVLPALLEAGFTEAANVIIVNRPWDESLTSNQMTFKVRFPVTAPHEYAGKTLEATNSTPFEDGSVVLIDADKQMLNSDDQLWHKDQPDMLQVPIGPVELPDAQFATPSEYRRAARMLLGSGYQLANKIAAA